MAERSSDQIQRDIERTRAEMSETIDALEQRLSPGDLVDELWNRVKAGETGTNIGATVRDHPVPLALMGLGLGWLAIEKATGSRTEELRARYGSSGEGTYARAEGRVGPYRGDEVIDADLRYDAHDGVGDRIGEAAEGLKDRVTGVGSEVRDRLGEVTGQVRDRFSAATESARERMYEMGDRSAVGGDGGPDMGERARRLRDGASSRMDHARETMHRRESQLEQTFHSLLDTYPLALGAISFGLGLAAGASVPTTRREDALMGEASDSLREEVKGTAREVASSVREAGSS